MIFTTGRFRRGGVFIRSRTVSERFSALAILMLIVHVESWSWLLWFNVPEFSAVLILLHPDPGDCQEKITNLCICARQWIIANHSLVVVFEFRQRAACIGRNDVTGLKCGRFGTWRFLEVYCSYLTYVLDEFRFFWSQDHHVVEFTRLSLYFMVRNGVWIFFMSLVWSANGQELVLHGTCHVLDHSYQVKQWTVRRCEIKLGCEMHCLPLL